MVPYLECFDLALVSVVDPDPLLVTSDADPNPALAHHCDADPDPEQTFQFDPDPQHWR